MDTGFIDLDILLTKIRNAQSKIYFLDAVKAYKAGALRASMASVWVALVYDLIAKYRELSAMGDAAATTFITDWDKATKAANITKLLQLEANILEDATANTQVVNRIAQTHLMRLREDRHLCAHPAFSAEAELFEPSPELVRLHLVNAVDLVLSQEPLQGKAIFDLFDVDVQSSGFPTDHARILDYVERRYLARVHLQNIRNFGMVLAKSLLKGVPPQWEAQQRKITFSLVAVSERAAQAWKDISTMIARLIDDLEPDHRPRAIAFIASFPDFWELLRPETQMALEETATNTDAASITDCRIFTGLTLPYFRDRLLAVIAGLDQVHLANAIAMQPLAEFWPRAIALYQGSISFEQSRVIFCTLISPFAGLLASQQIDQLLYAISANDQNWHARTTPTLLLEFLRNTAEADQPTTAARNRLYRQLRSTSYFLTRFDEVLKLFEVDGWVRPPAELVEED